MARERLTHADLDQMLERIQRAKAELPADDQSEPETYEQITRRQFKGGDLSAIADRMFRH